MEEYSNFEGCKNCQNPIVEQGYKIPLCKECRDKYRKFPVSKVVIVALIIVLGLAGYAYKDFPQLVKDGVHYKRAERAMDEKKYYTAIDELSLIRENHTESVELNSKLFISYVRCNYYYDAYQIYANEMEGEEISNDNLYEEVNSSYDEMYANIATSDELSALLEQVAEEPQNAYDSLINYIQSSGAEDIALAYLYLGYVCLDAMDYEQALSCYQYAMQIDQYLTNNAYLAMAELYIEQEAYEQAKAAADYILSSNVQDTRGLTLLSEISLGKNDVNEAINYALEAYSYDSLDTAVLRYLVLAYHANNQTAERDEYLEQLADLEYDNMEELLSIINGELEV